jgi:protein-S-isoprenylcysteine O-methyltransferase Ste14
MSAQYVLWLGWVVSAVAWALAWALWGNPKKSRSTKLDYANRAALTVGVILLFEIHTGILERYHWLWRTSEGMSWIFVLIAYLGFALAWWSHIALGHNARRAVVHSGPYRYVRHPMFLGIIIAAFAHAFMRGTIDVMLGAIIFTLGWYWRAEVEEEILRQELGAASYDAYANRTAMMVPFVWFGPFRVGAPGRGGE